jgi:hypothetical protein
LPAVGSQIFVDRVSPRDIRASAKSLLTFVTLGVGNFLGTLFTARRDVRFRRPNGRDSADTGLFDPVRAHRHGRGRLPRVGSRSGVRTVTR